MSEQTKKHSKRLFKFSRLLQRKENINVTDQVTKILCLKNAGLDNGVSQEEVLELCQPFGTVDAVIMLPQKPYAFVCYSTESEALAALASLDGALLRPQAEATQNLQLVIAHVDKAPTSVVPDSSLPPGLVLVENFVSPEMEQSLLRSLDWQEDKNDETQRTLKHRRVRHYGYEFKYGTNNVDPTAPLAESIPEECKELLDRAVAQGLTQHHPDQLTVNQYLPGQGIPPHVDTPSAFEDGIMSLSLGSAVVMEFRNPVTERHLSVLLPPRSLMVMTGDSRYLWTHGISPRKSDVVPTPTGGLTLLKRETRTSFTFRKLSATAGMPVQEREKPGSGPCLPRSEEEAKQLEQKHVHQVYELIADHFSDTRHTPWPQIADFLNSQAPGSLLADLGCGNGKYLHVNPSLFPLASDRSSQLCSIVRQRGHQVYVGDILHVPLRSGVFDVVLCIAVIHHLSTQERRQAAVAELVRVLAPGGQALVYVWAKDQKRQNQRSKYIQRRRGANSNMDCQDSGDVRNGVSSGTACTDHSQHRVGEGEETADCGDGRHVIPTETSSSSAKGVSQHGDGENGVATEKALSAGEDDLQKVRDGMDRQLELGSHTQGTAAKAAVDSDNSAPCVDRTMAPDAVSKPECHQSHTADCSENHIDQVTSDPPSAGSAHSAGSSSSGSAPATATGPPMPNVQPLPVHKNRTEFQAQDMLVPWKLKGKKAEVGGEGEDVHLRFYHVFEEGELEALCAQVPHCRVIRSYYDQGNWCVVLQKCS